VSLPPLPIYSRAFVISVLLCEIGVVPTYSTFVGLVRFERSSLTNIDGYRSVDLLVNADDPDDLASAPPDQDGTWHITPYLLPESDPDYDERHALSNALKDWDLDSVSEP
jgi:hypothetical protein